MGEIAQLIDQYGILIVAVVLLGSALIYVARLLYKELIARATRAEELVAGIAPSIDRLAASIDTHTEVVRAVITDRQTRP